MARYILIDNNSGYIWGDSANVNGRPFYGTPIAFARALDESLGTYDREYEQLFDLALGRNSGYRGYRVYRVDVGGSEAVTVVQDGQDPDTIATVERDCDEICFISITDVDP